MGGGSLAVLLVVLLVVLALVGGEQPVDPPRLGLSSGGNAVNERKCIMSLIDSGHECGSVAVTCLVLGSQWRAGRRRRRDGGRGRVGTHAAGSHRLVEGGRRREGVNARGGGAGEVGIGLGVLPPVVVLLLPPVVAGGPGRRRMHG